MKCQRCGDETCEVIELDEPIYIVRDGKSIDFHFLCSDCIQYFIDRLKGFVKN